MANRRMFSLSVIDTDKFLDMPVSSQLLYFHLGMRADDDGFVSSPKRIARTTNCGDDDLRILTTKGYIIPFESGVVVIRHWRQNNQLRSDRYRQRQEIRYALPCFRRRRNGESGGRICLYNDYCSGCRGK